jgi:hypothetical protein
VTTETPLFSEACSSCGCSTTYEATGTIVEDDDTVELELPSGASVLALQISGTWTGEIDFEGTIDGTNWVALEMQPLPTGDHADSTTANGAWQVNVAGYEKARAIGDGSITGEASVTMRATSGGASLPVPTSATLPYVWTRSSVTLTGGASDELLAADATRKAAIIYNRENNDPVQYDLTGAAIVDGEVPILEDDDEIVLTAPECPIAAVTGKGTLGDILTVYVGRLE